MIKIVIILLLSLGYLCAITSCGSSPAIVTNSPPVTPSVTASGKPPLNNASESVKQVVSTNGNESSIEKLSQSQIIEKEFTKNDVLQLALPLLPGDRVELEVKTLGENNGLISKVKDCFGNVIAQSATVSRLSKSGSVNAIYPVSVQEYPWNYAFFAAASGDYIIDFTDSSTFFYFSGASIHLRVTIN